MMARRVASLSKEDEIPLTGRVTEVCRGGTFRVSVENGDPDATHEVLAKLSGKMRKNSIKIVPGDQVQVVVSPYDLFKGRIVYRDKF